MSKYTTELRYIVESGMDLGLQDYPLHEFKDYGGSYRDQLNNKIIEHFSFREIGLETPALFKRFLNRKMNEIMPLFNQMYKSADIEFNPLWNIEIHETYTHTTNDDGSSTKVGTGETAGTSQNDGTNDGVSKAITAGSSTGNNVNTADTTNNVSGTSVDSGINEDEVVGVKADTPQGNMTDEDIKLHKFASSTDHNLIKNTKDNTNTVDTTTTNGGTITDASTGSNDDTVDNTSNETIANTGSTTGTVTTNDNINSNNLRSETFERLEEGSSAGLPYSNAIKQWRKIMINIDMMIIDELEPLFMQLW